MSPRSRMIPALELAPEPAPAEEAAAAEELAPAGELAPADEPVQAIPEMAPAVPVVSEEVRRSAAEIRDEQSRVGEEVGGAGRNVRQLEDALRAFDTRTTSAADLFEQKQQIDRLKATISWGEQRLRELRTELKAAELAEGIAAMPEKIEALPGLLDQIKVADEAKRAAIRASMSALTELARLRDAVPEAHRFDLPDVPEALIRRAAVLLGDTAPRLWPNPKRDDGRRAIIEVGQPGVRFVGPWTQEQKDAWYRFHHGRVSPPAAVTFNGDLPRSGPISLAAAARKDPVAARAVAIHRQMKGDR